MATSPNPQFPLGIPQRVALPSNLPHDKLPGYRIAPPRQAVRPAPVADPLADASTFQPISAVYLDSKFALQTMSISECDPYPYFLNDFTSRLTLYLTGLRPAWDDNSATSKGLAIALGAVPQPYEFQVRVATDHISETVFQGLVTPSSFNDNGMLVELSGFLGTQWEVWGRIPNPTGAAFPMELRHQFLLDRVGVGILPPFVGRLVTVEKIQYMP